jgi:hypothetical protein
MPEFSFPAISAIFHPDPAAPVELTAAAELARLSRANVAASPEPGAGVNLALASRNWTKKPLERAKSANATAWMWLRIADDGTGEIVATHGSFLFAAVRLLGSNAASVNSNSLTREKLAAGIFLPATFAWNRPHWDACYAQYWRSARGFDPEQYVATLAEAGFTHAEVNSLQTHMPYEDLVAWEYYPQFYTYSPGLQRCVAAAGRDRDGPGRTAFARSDCRARVRYPMRGWYARGDHQVQRRRTGSGRW